MVRTISLVVLCIMAPALASADATAADANGSSRTASIPAVQSSRQDTFDLLPPLKPGEDFHVSDLELARFLEIVLRENPDILSVRHVWMSSRERPAQVRSLPDPSLGVRYFAESIETRIGPQRYSLELTQGLPWLSKLSTEGRRAERLTDSIREMVRQIERDHIRDFKRSYYDLIYFGEALRINAEERELLHRFEQIALTRYATGVGIQQNAIKVQTEITLLLDQMTTLTERRDILSGRLAQLLGRPEAPLQLPRIVLREPEIRHDGEDLEARAIQARPDLGALRAKIWADELLVKRRRLDYRPDFSFGIAFTNVGRREDPAGALSPPPHNGDDALAFVARITIPLHTSRLSAGVQEAREILNADVRLLEDKEDRVRFDVQEASLHLKSFLERTALYRDNLIPQAEQSLFSSEAAYQTNQLDFLDLLDAERVWFRVRLTYQRLLSDVWIAAADLERATGKPFPSSSFEDVEPSR
ncbi:MAG: TolC family protein [Acidobacteria bacterium]|nr:TolC family protein [Acidobacteriota bacterium]